MSESDRSAAPTMLSVVLAESALADPEAARRALESLPQVAMARFVKPEAKTPRLRRLLNVYLTPGTEALAALASLRAHPKVAAAELPARRKLL